MKPIHLIFYKLYRRVLKGRSDYRNARRYELILNILFCSSLLASLLSAVFAALDSHHRSDNTILNIALFTASLIVLWWLSRAGRHTLTAFALAIGSSLALANVMFTRRFGLPDFEIGAALCLMVVGVLLEIRLTRSALAAERDHLEQRVIERTKQLEEMQLRCTLELQRFAEFGRLSAQLLHDVATPLTVASLHLEQADHRSSLAIRQARRSLQQLERYVSTARKQLQQESQPIEFVAQKEMKQLLSILRPVAQKAGVRLVINSGEAFCLHGDPVRFNQIMANVIANAIDAYADTSRTIKRPQVTVSFTKLERFGQITVHDQGKGITPIQLPRIFEPFYTTKQSNGRGLGIGLATVKRSVRQDFQGTICANSTLDQGTTFTMFLRLQPQLGAANNLVGNATHFSKNMSSPAPMVALTTTQAG